MPFKPVDIAYEQIVVEMLQRLSANTSLTDVNPGSVVRLLVEAFSLELAEAYATMSAVYDMGFVSTATEESLDLLVALLGIRRYVGPEVIGQVRFVRDSAMTGNITIPAGTQLSKIQLANKAKVLYRTDDQDVTLQAGQQSVTVPITAIIPAGANPQDAVQQVVLTADDVGTTDEEAAMTLAVPIAGIQQAVLLFPTSLRQQTETDEELRTRAKSAVMGAGGGTHSAIQQAIRNTGLVTTVTFPPSSVPGVLLIGVSTDLTDTQKASTIMDAVQQVKAAGIVVQLQPIVQKQIVLKLTLSLANAQAASEQRSRISQLAAQQAAEAVRSLQPGQSLNWGALTSSMLQIPGILDVKGHVVPHTGQTGQSSPTAPEAVLMQPGTSYPPDPLTVLEHITLAPVRSPVEIAFADRLVLVKLMTNMQPAHDQKTIVANALGEKLEQQAGSAELAWNDLAVTLQALPLVAGGKLAFQITADSTVTLLQGPNEYISLRSGSMLALDPAGPGWGVDL